MDAATLTPAQALREIAFLLEREGAPRFKIQAFHKAATAIEALDDDDLAARARDGRLRRTPGIGERSLEVIRQALEGDVPGYLADLRERNRTAMSPEGRTLRDSLRGDLHSHSEWSDGNAPIPRMIAAAESLGHEYLALTDHSPNLTVANGLTAERLAEQLSVSAELDAAHPSLRLLTGIEVDILEDGTLDQRPELLDRLDVVVASVHSKLRADAPTMTRRMLRAIEDPHTNVLGHCTGRLVQGQRGTRPPSDFDAETVFAACAEHSVAVEINSLPERQDPPDELIAMALDAGCLFSINSDAHAGGQLGLIDYGAERAAAAGVPAERIVTTWPVAELLAWSRAAR
ncbi:MAG: PHP domain-containing protein [Microbacterium sp.]|nr:PHP domain-containing protein [Microbacterium sp.]